MQSFDSSDWCVVESERLSQWSCISLPVLLEKVDHFFSFLVRIFHYGMIGRRSSFAKGRLFSSYSCLWLIFATSTWFHKWIFVVFGRPFHVHPFFSWNTLKFLPCLLRQYLLGKSQKFDTLLLPNLYLPLHHMK